MSDKPFNLLDGPDTGLKEDYNGTITSAMFTQNTQGTNQNYSLQLVVDADDGEQAIIRLGVGKSWSSYDGGETVVGATSTARFHQSTAYWRFITAASASGAGEEMAKRNEAYSLLGPCHANFWVGMRFHFDVAIDHNAQTQNETGQWVKVEGGRAYATVDKYLGVADSALPAQPSFDDAADTQILAGIASRSSDHRDFMAQVSAARGSNGEPLIKNREVVVKIADEKWFESLKAGA